MTALLEMLAKEPGDAIAIEDAGGEPRSWTYIRDLTNRAASRLRTAIAPGDRVGLLLEPGAEWLAAFLAILQAGAAAVPLHTRYPDREIAALLADAGARLLLCDQPRNLPGQRWSRDDLFTPLRGDTPHPGHRGDTPHPGHDGGTPHPGHRGGTPHPGPGVDNPLAMLLYTSGTTGHPKGAMLTHDNLAAGVTAVVESWQLRGRRALLHALPLHHLHGIAVALLPCLAAGMRVRMLPSFDAVKVWGSLAGVDTFMGVPTMYHRLLAAHAAAEPDTRARWSAAARALGLAASGSAALPESTAAGWEAIAGSIPLERWGMTEIGIGLSNPLDPAGRRRGRVGMPFGDMKLRIDDEGELWVRGPTVFCGYFGRQGETASAFRDGWFRTGDVAERDAEGSYRILGRISVDIIKSGGFKISALEIEECLRDHPAIDDIAVVALPDEAYGERVAAAVVLRANLSADELIGWARDCLAAYKIPRQIEFVDALPQNAVGKVEKPRVVALITARRSRG